MPPTPPAPPTARATRAVLAVRLALLLILLVAALLRFGAVGWGLPYWHLGVDEGTTHRVVSAMVQSRSWDPHFHRWPNLTMYVSAAVFRVTDALCATFHLWPPTPYVIGRSVVAVTGVLTVLLLYAVAARLFGRPVGLLSAGFLATMPLHVERSRMWLLDAPMALAYALTFWLTVRLFERPTVARFALAGLGVGLATATKYNGAGACFLVVVAALASHGAGNGKTGGAGKSGVRDVTRTLCLLALAGVCSLAAFALADPYSWLDVARFRQDMAHEANLYTQEPSTGPLGWYGMSFIVRELFRTGAGPYVSILALAGLAVLLVRRPRGSVLVWAPALLYLFVYNVTFRTPLPRNFVPLLLHVAIAAAIAVSAAARALERLAARWRPAAGLARALPVVALLVPLPQALGTLHALRSGDTRIEADQWLQQNLPVGARVRREWPILRLNSDRYSVNERGMLPDVDSQALREWSDYLVACSEAWDYVLGQRTRPGYGERAARYDRVFSGEDFELVARFTADLTASGPEVRVYRNRRPRAPVLAAGCLDLADSAVAPARALNRQSRHTITIARAGEALGGQVEILEPGRHVLEVEVEAAPSGAPQQPFPVVLGLGKRARLFRVTSERSLRLEADLPSGLVWWRIEVGREWKPDTTLRIWRPTLRPSGDAVFTSGGSGFPGAAPLAAEARAEP